MKTLIRLAMLSIALCAIVIAPVALAAPTPVSADQSQKIAVLVESYAKAYKAKDLNALEAMLDKDTTGMLRSYFEEQLKAIFEKEMQSAAFDDVRADILDSRVVEGEGIRVRLGLRETVRKSDGATTERDRGIFLILNERNGTLAIKQSVHELTLGDGFDPASRVYTSPKGQYTIKVADGWIPVHAIGILNAIVPESLALWAPDMKSYAVLGFIQLPMKMSPKQAVETDASATGRMTKDYVRKEEGETQVAGMPAYRLVSEFSLNEGPDAAKRRREQLYFAKDKLLYFMLFDAMPPEAFDTLKPSVDAMMGTFALAPVEGGIATEEKIAEQFGQGSVTGRTYTNDEFNCFIAAPEGWEMDTSPNPAHLVQITRKNGNSMARLIAAKNAQTATLAAKDAFEGRLAQLKPFVQDFKEVSRRDLTVGGAPAIESVQSFKLEGMGAFEVKELTVVRGGVYYLVLCQAISPDTLEKVGKDFDEIMKSFGFTK